MDLSLATLKDILDELDKRNLAFIFAYIQPDKIENDLFTWDCEMGGAMWNDMTCLGLSTYIHETIKNNVVVKTHIIEAMDNDNSNDCS